MSTHHNLDIRPVPDRVLFINEVAIADDTAIEAPPDPEQPDNVRVYVPLDLNRRAIIRRLEQIGVRNGDPTEGNEFCFASEVGQIIAQLDIYDQVWYIREKNFANSPEEKHHSVHGKELVEEMLDILESWEENSSAELFPIEQIDELEEEYEIVREHHWR